MATDISSSVTAEYTAAIPVLDDGEALDFAAVVQFTLPLANRIEFLNSQINNAPWVIVDVFDDFTQRYQETVTPTLSRLHCDRVWESNHDAEYFLGSGSTLDDAVGVLALANITAGALDMTMSTRLDYLFSACQRFTARVQFPLGLDASNTWTFGLSDGLGPGPSSGDSAVRLSNTAGGDWVLTTEALNVSSSITLVGTAPTIGVYQQLDIFHDGVGGWTASIDGGGTVAAVSNIPAGSLDTRVQVSNSSTAAGNRTVFIDFINARFLSPTRVL